MLEINGHDYSGQVGGETTGSLDGWKITKNDKDRIFLLEEITSAKLKLAEMDFADLAEEAAPYIISGELMPMELRARIQEGLGKLKAAREAHKEANALWRQVMGR